MELNNAQAAALVALLWDYMKPDREHPDRVHTSFGTKTRTGLCACIERVITENEAKP